MNNLYTHNKIIISKLFLGIALFYYSLNGITVNNTPLEQIITPDQVLSFTPHTKDKVTFFDMQNGNINLGFDDITKLDNLKEVFETLNKNKSGGFRSKICNLSSNTANYNGSYLVGQERINIEARTSLNLNNCLLESPDIAIIVIK
jgi:hypothetical protein